MLKGGSIHGAWANATHLNLPSINYILLLEPILMVEKLENNLITFVDTIGIGYRHLKEGLSALHSQAIVFHTISLSFFHRQSVMYN